MVVESGGMYEFCDDFFCAGSDVGLATAGWLGGGKMG